MRAVEWRSETGNAGGTSIFHSNTSCFKKRTFGGNLRRGERRAHIAPTHIEWREEDDEEEDEEA